MPPGDLVTPERARELLGAEKDLRSLHISLAYVQRMIEADNIGGLATINESLQPVVDAMIAHIGRRREADRLLIHDLETRCDPAGDVQTIASLTEQRDALVGRVRELERTVLCADCLDDGETVAARYPAEQWHPASVPLCEKHAEARYDRAHP